jgi:hypothetical protein
MKTTLHSLTLEQVNALESEASVAGDYEIRDDCAALVSAYLRSEHSELSDLIDDDRGAIRDAARRVVRAINEAEAQVTLDLDTEEANADNNDRMARGE